MLPSPGYPPWMSQNVTVGEEVGELRISGPFAALSSHRIQLVMTGEGLIARPSCKDNYAAAAGRASGLVKGIHCIYLVITQGKGKAVHIILAQGHVNRRSAHIPAQNFCLIPLAFVQFYQG